MGPVGKALGSGPDVPITFGPGAVLVIPPILEDSDKLNALLFCIAVLVSSDSPSVLLQMPHANRGWEDGDNPVVARAQMPNVIAIHKCMIASIVARPGCACATANQKATSGEADHDSHGESCRYEI